MHKRLLYHQISQNIEHKNALVITGMRQVGKTTLMKQLFDAVQDRKKVWFDFDNPLDQKVFENEDYKFIFKRLLEMAKAQADDRLLVCIDEIQNYPEVTRVMKYLIDHYGVKFIVTGSSNYYLKNLFPESLSGRKFLYHLSPLSFREYLYFRDMIPLDEALRVDILFATQKREIVDYKAREHEYEEYLRFGGFPEVVTTRDPATKRLVLKNIFSSFFEKDLKILSDYKGMRELRDLILLLVPRVSSQLDITKLSSELGINRTKVYQYLEFLEGTFFIRLISKFSKSIDRKVAGGKKVYFTDTGILNAIGSVNDGQLFENAVINQLAEYGNVSFYNRRNTAEIDAILAQTHAFEIKLNGTREDVARLRKLAIKLHIRNQFVISKSFREKDEGVAYPMFL